MTAGHKAGGAEGQGREPRASQEGGGSYGGKAEPVIRGGAGGCGGPHGGKAEPVIRGGVAGVLVERRQSL